MNKNVLITGAARRIGAECARFLHGRGCNVCIHYRNSAEQALQLSEELNQTRPGSALVLQADLLDLQELTAMASELQRYWQGIDALVNNASAFYATDIATVSEREWDELLGSNLKAPFFLIQALLPALKMRGGCVVNIVDIHAERGLKGFPVYSIAKAGLAALTVTLAKELAPDIRVNGISPGAMLWPEHGSSADIQTEILQRVALQRLGTPSDIAQALNYLIFEADYMTGQIMTIDGGRTLFC